MEKLKCKDCWYFEQTSTGKQGSVLGRCKIRNSRTDKCGGRNQHNKACKQIKLIDPITTVLVQMEVNKARTNHAILGIYIICLKVVNVFLCRLRLRDIGWKSTHRSAK